MDHEIEDGDVAIIIKPELDEDGEWSGALKTGLVFGGNQNPMAMRAAMDLAMTMAATTHVLEDYPELHDYFDDARIELVKQLFPKAYAETEREIEKEMDYTTEGNVIKLTKWTKTMGEA